VSILYHTTGIVLNKRDWRESDRVYSVLTREHGKVEIIGRGARKALAKLSPHLEFCAEVDLLVVRGRAHETVAGVERRRAFSGLYENFPKTLLAHHMLQLVDLGTREREADRFLYDEVKNFLIFLHKAPGLSSERAAFLLSAFALKLLALLGYRPELGQCLQCREAIRPSEFAWHALRGGVVCRACVAADKEQWLAVQSISDDTLRLLRFALSERFAELLRPKLTSRVLLGYHEATEGLLVAHFPTIPATTLRAACKLL
jgi:DNA repair protein RecO (recombination protein O)